MIKVSIIPRPVKNISSMINMPPFFERDPSSQRFDVAKMEFNMSLPEIIDSHENFCTIEIESSSFGRTFFSNISEETPSNELMSYDMLTNSLKIQIPDDSMSLFEGNHTMNIVLRDTLGAETEYTFYLILND